MTTPRIILQAEAAALLVISLFAYAQTGASWGLFAALILAPDLFMLGYLAKPRIGAALYNLAHTTVLPLAALGFAHAYGQSLAIPLIWLAHIGADRMLGYGLKYPDAFKHTHLDAQAV